MHSHPDFHSQSGGAVEESVEHNILGAPYSIKLVYPGFYGELNLEKVEFTVGFPKSKRRLARQVDKGHLFFMYVTAPEKWIIGLAQVLEPAKETPFSKRPYQVPLRWVVGPKNLGVRFLDVDLKVKPRIGDSLYSVEVKDALNTIQRLRELPDMTEEDLIRKKRLYR